MRRLTTRLALVVLALVATACQARVDTRVVVTDVDQASLAMQVAFTGDAAIAVTRGNNLDGLLETFQARTGVEPDVVRDGDRVGVAAELTYAQLTAVADITGVGGLQLRPLGDDSTEVTLELVEPAALRRAVAQAVAQDETGATFAAMASTTSLTTTVELVGGVHEAQAPDTLPVSVEQTTVVVEQTLADFTPGSVVVVGTPGVPGRGPLGLPWPVLLGIAAALVVLSGALVPRLAGSR